MHKLCSAIILLLALFVADALSAQAATPQRRIIKLKDSGPEPRSLQMTRDDSIVFFYNDTSDSLPTLEIDFRGETAHCASAKLKAGADGFIRSAKAIGPGDFASTCFHSAGTYNGKVLGLRSNPQGIPFSIKVD